MIESWREACIEAERDGREVCYLNTLEASIGALQVAGQRLKKALLQDARRNPAPYLIWLAGLIAILIFFE